MATHQEEEQSAEDGIRANIAQIVEAINDKDLIKYGSLVTPDLVNMTKHGLEGELISTESRQARLDELKTSFEGALYTSAITMEASEIFAEGDRGFARIDGTVSLTPKQEKMSEFSQAVDLYLFYRKDKEHGWLTERSMAIMRPRSDD